MNCSIWRRTGVGRVLHAFPLEPDVIAVSELGIIAHLRGKDGELKWRTTPPSAGFHLLSVVLQRKTSRGTVVLSSSSERKISAYIVGDPRPLWQMHACNLRPCSERSAIVDKCDGQVLSVDILSGEINGLGEKQEETCTYEKANAWTLEDNRSFSDIRIIMAGRELRSFVDGQLTLLEGDNVIWSREEGLSHIVESSLYTPGVKDKRASILVARSYFGVVYALDASRSGHILWKSSVGRNCRVVAGHPEMTVVVCADDATIVHAFRVQNGDVVLRENFEEYKAVQAVVDQTCNSEENGICVHLLNNEGKEMCVGRPTSCTVSETIQHRGWLTLAPERSEIRGLQNGNITWRVAVPTDSLIVRVESGKPFHPSTSKIRAPAVRVTGDRRVLFRHVDQDVALILTENKKQSLLHAMLLDAKTGSLLDTVTHPEASGPVAATRGQSWFIYSFWNKAMLEQEIHILDMYEPEEEVTKVHHALHQVVNSTLGKQIAGSLPFLKNDHNSQCYAPLNEKAGPGQCARRSTSRQDNLPKIPVILRASVLAAKRIIALDVTETTLGLVEPSIALTLEGGQVALVSRILLDARRPKDPSKFNSMEYLIPYRPLVKLHSSSPESKYASLGESVLGLRHVSIGPVSAKESLCQVFLIGVDIIYSLEHPVGSFDAPSEDFSYISVLGMLVTLAAALFYTNRLKKKARLSKSW